MSSAQILQIPQLPTSPLIVARRDKPEQKAIAIPITATLDGLILYCGRSGVPVKATAGDILVIVPGTPNPDTGRPKETPVLWTFSLPLYQRLYKEETV